MNTLVERAKELAYRAHAGQMDKAGRPYIEHVARVAAAVADDPEAEAVAWLHDVLEDAPLSFQSEVANFPDRIIFAVMDISRIDDEELYYMRVKTNDLAMKVKLADIADNSDESRLALLDEKTAARLRRKYKKALEALTC